MVALPAEKEIIELCERRIVHFEKNSTAYVQEFVLRGRKWEHYGKKVN